MGKASRRKANQRLEPALKSRNGFVIGFDADFGMVATTENEKIIMEHINQMPERDEVLFGISERRRLKTEMPLVIRIGDGVILFTISSGFQFTRFMGGTDVELFQKAERYKQVILNIIESNRHATKLKTA